MTIPHGSFAGDLLPEEAWALLKTEPEAELVDVRTGPEWAFVGLPDLSEAGREPIRIEWQSYPSMGVNESFVADLSRSLSDNPSKARPLLFLCRSGARSRAAAIAATQAGFTRAYNIAGGFEGDLDPKGHRGVLSGWKAANLPWQQT